MPIDLDALSKETRSAINTWVITKRWKGRSDPDLLAEANVLRIMLRAAEVLDGAPPLTEEQIERVRAILIAAPAADVEGRHA